MQCQGEEITTKIVCQDNTPILLLWDEISQ